MTHHQELANKFFDLLLSAEVVIDPIHDLYDLGPGRITFAASEENLKSLSGKDVFSARLNILIDGKLENCYRSEFLKPESQEKITDKDKEDTWDRLKSNVCIAFLHHSIYHEIARLQSIKAIT